MANKSKPQRIDPEFEKEMKTLAQIRLQQGLAKFKSSELSVREMTNLLRKTDGYRISIEELKRKPKKR